MKNPLTALLNPVVAAFVAVILGDGIQSFYINGVAPVWFMPLGAFVQIVWITYAMARKEKGE